MIDAGHRRVGFLVAGCFFMEIMDGTIVSTAAPRLSEALRVPVSSIGLLITALPASVERRKQVFRGSPDSAPCP